MLEYTGKYGKAKVMIDSLDPETVKQIYSFLNHEAFTNPIAIMPDAHAGAGAVIGFTMPMTDQIIPNIVGVDINCGMLAMKMEGAVFANISRKNLDKAIRAAIPFGKEVHKSPKLWYLENQDFQSINTTANFFTSAYNERYNTNYAPPHYSMEWLKDKCDQIGIKFDRVVNSVGTLGSGNHFIEIGKSVEDGSYWITIHSGSRQFGLKIANYWQHKAGRGELASLFQDEMFGYLTDMYFAAAYAHINRLTMAHIITQNILEMSPVESIETVHNFIDFSDFIIRKGAVKAHGGKIIIPFNMEDGLLICRGKSNPEWNYSAPHGAGRIGPRNKTKKKLKHKEDKIRKRMEDKGIYFSKLPLDETAEAYKDPKIIEQAIEPTAEIIDRVAPVLAMKD